MGNRKLAMAVAGAALAIVATLTGVTATASPHAAEKSPSVSATLVRQKDGFWRLTYRFQYAAPAWFFTHSNPTMDDKPWRPLSWTVETPGVHLSRRGRYDVMSSDDGSPLNHVSILVKPFGDHLKAEYVAFMIFSDGGVALYSEHYRLEPLKSAAEADSLPADLNDSHGVVWLPVTLTVRTTDSKLLMSGKAYRRSVTLPLGQGGYGTYIYAGTAPVIDMPAFSGIVDPGLPAWFRTEVSDFTPRLFSYYRERLGPSGGARPMAYVSWSGPTGSGTSFGGSVLKDTVILVLGGAGAGKSSPPVLNAAHWFLGHESSHFWLGETVRYDGPSSAWITEGGADLMAIRALDHLTPGYDARAELQRSLKDCLKLSGADKPLSGASARGEVRANYACGGMLMLAAEGAARKRDAKADLFTWMRAFIDANREDGIIDEADWLKAFGTVTDPATVSDVRGFIDHGVASPTEFFARLFTATGIGFTREGDKLTLT